ncbi:DUF4625 domain-containing protein [Candidatus Pacearchaeota archaeon]|nr:DUF4625 domain-containing protein [Candidatus Pacearchaeota archaeon]
MKRGLILLLLLILIPVASATIDITGPTKSQYNIGDEIEFSGYVETSEDFSGTLKFYLICGSKTYNLQRFAVDLSTNERLLFSQISMDSITASSTMLGLCKIKAELVANDVVVDRGYSYNFEINNDLTGTFTLDKSSIMLGDSVTLTGTLYKANGDLLDGTAEIYLVYGSEEYLMGFVDVTNGAFIYTTEISATSPGTYYISLTARDSYSNEETFTKAESFTVSDALSVYLDTNALSFYPSDVLNVFGDVQTDLNGAVSSAVVEVALDDTKVSTSLDQSKFTQDLIIPSDITTGTHDVSVSARDTFGNTGETSIEIEILPLATSIEVFSSNSTLVPEDLITLTSNLYDQTDEFMSDSLLLQVYDSDNNLVSERTINSGESITYQIPQYATPGLWEARASYSSTKSSVSTSLSFTIEEVQALDYRIEGDILYLTNIGNVRYTEDLNIPVEGIDQAYLISRTKRLDPSESIAIDLTDELPTGTYTLSIPTGFGIIEESLSIEDGKSASSLTWLYTILVIALIAGISYLTYTRVKPKKTKEKEIASKKNAKEKIKLYDPKREKAKKKNSLVFEDKEEGLRDFKERTLEEIKKTEEKISRDSKKKAFMSEGKLGYITGKNDPSRQEQKEKPVIKLFDDE